LIIILNATLLLLEIGKHGNNSTPSLSPVQKPTNPSVTNSSSERISYPSTVLPSSNVTATAKNPGVSTSLGNNNNVLYIILGLVAFGLVFGISCYILFVLRKKNQVKSALDKGAATFDILKTMSRQAEGIAVEGLDIKGDSIGTKATHKKSKKTPN